MESNSVRDDTSDQQKPGDGAAGVISSISSMITDRIGLHKLLLQLNDNYKKCVRYFRIFQN